MTTEHICTQYAITVEGGEEQKTQLYAALVQAQRLAKSVSKEGWNDYHKYKYASAETMIAEARTSLGEAGLAVLAQSWDMDPYDNVDTKNGGTIGRMVVQYRVLHTAGASIVSVCSTPVVSGKGKPDDKAEATALTYNFGYFMRGLLCLPRVDASEDVDQRDDRDYQPRSDARVTRGRKQKEMPRAVMLPSEMLARKQKDKLRERTREFSRLSLDEKGWRDVEKAFHDEHGDAPDTENVDHIRWMIIWVESQIEAISGEEEKGSRMTVHS